MKRRLLLAALLLAPLVALSLHSVCDLCFDCGCAPIWAGGLDHCNVHSPGPHCPWCAGGLGRKAWVGAILTTSIALPAWRGARRRLSIALILGAAGYVIGTLVASGLAALLDRYPRWLWF